MRGIDRYLNEVFLATATVIGFQYKKTLCFPPMFHCVSPPKEGKC